MNAAWQQRTRLTCCNAHSSHTPVPWTTSRVQRYSSSMHRAMEEDSLMIRHDDDDVLTGLWFPVVIPLLDQTHLHD